MKKKKRIPHYTRAPIVITLHDIADLLHVSYTTVWRWTDSKPPKLKFDNDHSWNNFWILVAYLESKGYRPTKD